MKKGTHPIVASASPEKKADWLEWRALRDTDGTVSEADLRKELARSGSADALASDADPVGIDDPQGNRVEQLAQEAFATVKRRVDTCGGAEKYPFAVGDSWIQRKPAADSMLYTFLLLLSVYGPTRHRKGDEPAGTFEEVARYAAEGYAGGPTDAVGTRSFGFPRRIKPAGFRDAVLDLCVKTGEGSGANARRTIGDQKDGKLDLIVWRRFADSRAGKWWAFGQCAAGGDWLDKVSELQPDAFCDMWIIGDIPVKPGRLFFVPHAIDADHWFQVSRTAGIVFDRFRIVSCVNNVDKKTERAFRSWSKRVLTREVRVEK